MATIMTEVVEVTGFQANVHWIIGLEDRSPLGVLVFQDTARLVIDIAD